MNGDKITYRGGYKYQLLATYRIQTGIETNLPSAVGNDWVRLYPSGFLEIEQGYAWDGASGPTIDTKDTMRGSLVHDALYQLIREGSLGMPMKAVADSLFRSILREDGMDVFRAGYYYLGVKVGGGKALKGGPRPPEVAP